MLAFYLRNSLRSLQRRRAYTILNTLGLGIGICVLLLATEYYVNEKGYNRWHAHLPHLYRVNISGRDGVKGETFPALAPLMETGIPGVREAVRFGNNFNGGALLSYTPEGRPSLRRSFREEGCVFVDASFLDAFSFPLTEGSNQLMHTNTTVITRRLARQLFGEEKAVGKTIELHNQFGELPLTVTGVLADIPAQSDLSFDCLLSMEILRNPGYTAGADWARPDSWGNESYYSFVWLDPTTSPAAVAQKATAIWRSHDPDYKPEKGVIRLQPVGDMHLGDSLHDDNPTYASLATVRFIMALGILICCIAWINFINFSSAFAISQARQIGIHKVAGSQKKDIVLRYIVESLVLNIAGLMVGLLLTMILQPLFNRLAGKELSIGLVVVPGALVIIASVLCIGIFTCGGYVGYLLARFKPVTMMQFNRGHNPGAVALRKGLIVFQFSLACLCITSTLISYRQVNFMRHRDLGMNISKLVVVKGPAIRDSSSKTNEALFKEALGQLSFVEKVSITGSIPGMDFSHNFSADGVTGAAALKGDERKEYSISEVDEQFFSVYHIPFVAGGDFTSSDAVNGYHGDHLIVNETAARQLGYKPAMALGRPVNWGRQYRIIGIVKDYHHRSVKEKIEPIIYVPNRNNGFYTVAVNQDQLSSKLAVIQSLYQRLYPGNPFEYSVLQDTFDRLYRDDERSGDLAMCFSLLVILISCMGLAGLSVFTVQRRAKEISVRKVLGAGPEQLFGLLSGEFLRLVVVAFVLATPVSWMLINHWLNGYAYRTDIPWWIFAFTCAACLFIALTTISVQTVRAALNNPVDGLRAE